MKWSHSLEAGCYTETPPGPGEKINESLILTDWIFWRKIQALACLETMQQTAVLSGVLFLLSLADARTPLFIGALFPMTSLLNDSWTGGRGILPAARIALGHVNKANVLRNYELMLVWNDTRVSTPRTHSPGAGRAADGESWGERRNDGGGGGARQCKAVESPL